MVWQSKIRETQYELWFSETDSVVDGRLPRALQRVSISPIKCQGIKSKLVRFIMASLNWDGTGVWIEPFVGSGVVALNVAPRRALLTDSNPHVIRLFQDISAGRMTPESVRSFLEMEGEKLRVFGDVYYYEVRDRFNAEPSSHDFLFLNRSCFNGMIRFNRRGHFNVPFGKKTERFSKAYVTKIVNQIRRCASVIANNDWRFEVTDWRDILALAKSSDFVYADPPYVDRHTDYYNSWDGDAQVSLMNTLKQLPCGFALSTWKENRYRRNTYVPTDSTDLVTLTENHYYYVGSKESLRHSMVEALVVKKGYNTNGY